MQLTRVLRATGAFLVAGLLFGTAAHAQSGVITGTVTDANSKQPAADVVVTASSPNLQGEQVVVTDATGQYRIPQLPTGNYSLRFENEAFQPYSRSGIQLRVDRTIRVNVELLPTGIQQDIVVVGTSPTVDVGSTSTGINVGADFIRQIAVVNPTGRGGAARSFESLADIAPGANADTYGVSISGTTSPENAYVIDGLSVNDPGFGILGTPLSVEFVQDVNVITGGYMPEYGRATGGVLNAVTKSGSNEFHGSVFGNWTPGSLEGTAKEVTSEASSISRTTQLHNLGDIGAELGGPILKDKLWFYAGFAPSFTRFNVERGINARIACATPGVGNCDEEGLTHQGETVDGDYAVDRLASTTRNTFADQRSLQYIGKLTYLVNADHNVSLSVYGSPTRSGSATSYAFDNQDGLPNVPVAGQFSALSTINRANSRDIALKTASSFLDKRLLLDVTAGWHHQTVSALPVDGSSLGSSSGLAGQPSVQFRRESPGYRGIADFELQDNAEVAARCDAPGTEGALLCPVQTYTVGGPGFINEDVLERYQAKGVVTYLANLAGRHVFKVGVDGESLRYDRTKAYTGNTFLQESTDAAFFNEFRNYAYLAGPSQMVRRASVNSVSTSNTLGGFVQDSWSVLDLFTVNAGVRYDHQKLYGDDRLLGLNLGKQISPRVGVLYDFTQQGRSKLYANFARFYESVPLDLADRSFPGDRQTQVLHPRSQCGLQPGGDLSASTAACQSTDPANLASRRNFNDPNNFITPTGSDRSAVDEQLAPQSSDEFVAGGEYELFDNARVGASLTRRYMGNVIEDMSRDNGNTYFIGNPGKGIAQDFPKAARDYTAVTLFFDKTFADLWLAQVSYTWSRLEGNYAGLFRPENGQLDPNINSDFDLVALLPNRSGPLPGDRTHSIKVFAAKEFVVTQAISFNLGATYRGRSGTPVSYLGAFDGYGNGEAFILERGAAGRTPWRNDVDGRLGFNYKLSEDNLVTVGVDVFNLFNFQTATLVDNNYTFGFPTPCVGGTDAKQCLLGQENPETGENFTEDDINPNFNNPTAFQAARSIRLGAKVTF